MKVKKISNEYNSFDIDLIQDEKVLSIYQTGSDINLSCKYEDYRKISSISFNIDSNQGEVYSVFDKFYTDIINGNILGENENLQSVQETMEYEKSTSWYKSLVQNGVITMLCDAYPIKCPNVLKIAKKDDEIILTFDKFDGGLPKVPYYISINVRQSGSRIYDFCIPFNTLFKQLQTVEDKKDAIKAYQKSCK